MAQVEYNPITLYQHIGLNEKPVVLDTLLEYHGYSSPVHTNSPSFTSALTKTLNDNLQYYISIIRLTDGAHSPGTVSRTGSQLTHFMVKGLGRIFMH